MSWTALAAVLTAVAALIGALAAARSSGTPNSSGTAQIATKTGSESTLTGRGAGPFVAIHTDWINAAVAICTQTDAELSQSVGSNSLAWQALPVIARKLKLMDAALRQLPLPDDNRPNVLLMTQDWDIAAEGYRAAAQAERRGDGSTTYDALRRSSVLNGEGNQIARELGISRCADVGATLADESRW